MECEIDYCEKKAEFVVAMKNIHQNLCEEHTKKTIEMLNQGMFSPETELTVRLLNGYAAGRRE